MTDTRQVLLILLGIAILAFEPALAAAYPGVPTRDQNPLLQGYFIPAMPVSSQQEWSFSHSLHITNTYQVDSNTRENLVIDVENRRYDFQATHRLENWKINIGLSLVDNHHGFLDQTIEGWHDFFGFPQGGRDTAINDRLALLYQKNGVTIFDFQNSNSGLSDIQLAAGTKMGGGELWLALELPSGTSNSLISNDGVDLALWYTNQSQATKRLTVYGMGGVVFPGDDGLFKNSVNDQYLFGQLGLLFQYNADWHFFFQADAHSEIVSGSDLDALDHSLQGQFGLRLPSIMKSHQLDMFFSEDLLPGHAPDISFSARISPRY